MVVVYLIFMLKVSTRSDYGLLFMVSLATYPRDQYISLSSIASEKHLSSKYLSRLMTPLKRAGLIKSKEGVSGGFKLAKDPKEITMAEIINVLEGKSKPVRCMCVGDNTCKVKNYCTTKDVWSAIYNEIYDLLDKKTLADCIPDNTLIKINK